MRDCKVNILGTEYDITMDCDDEDRDGETNFFSKNIRVRPLKKCLIKKRQIQKEKSEKSMLPDTNCFTVFCGKREKRNLPMMNTL